MVIGHDKYALSNAVDRELYRMSDIWRYNSRLIHRDENLAENSKKIIDRMGVSHYNRICAMINYRQLSTAQYTTGGRLGVILCQM